jgi:hypothetical protein
MAHTDTKETTMRTKLLIVAAAITAAGLATSLAQSNVYSQNVVGFINLSLGVGNNQIANQLDADLTGTNNTVAGVFSTNLPSGATVYTWVPSNSSYTICSYTVSKGVPKWTGATNIMAAWGLQMGQGCVVYVPSATTVTLVGNVMQGSLSTPLAASPEENLVSSQVPQSGGIQTTLGYAPAVGDTVYVYQYAGQTYSGGIYNYVLSKGVPKWSSAGEPQLAVGQPCFIVTTNTAWNRTFTVQ